MYNYLNIDLVSLKEEAKKKNMLRELSLSASLNNEPMRGRELR